MSFVGVDSLPPLWCETPTSARRCPGLFLCIAALTLSVAALPARAEPSATSVAPELIAAARTGETFDSLATRARRAWAYDPVPYLPVQYNSWDMKDWPGSVPIRRRVVHDSEQNPSLPERGRELFLLGLAWLGKLSR